MQKHSISTNKKKKLMLQLNKKKLNAPELKPRLKQNVKDWQLKEPPKLNARFKKLEN